jgi:hypothetical protein
VRRETGAAWTKLAFYLGIPCLFFLIPTRWLEAHPAPCLYRLLFRRRCPACGMTRAISAAAHGRFKRSLEHNWLVVIALPLGVLAWFQGLTVAYRNLRELSQ